ncbi:Uu.00g105020.m01.CDS01 [Anthostomella pinea]|uniref:Uu.00g105020.m01.CDS01 n=1 Tax=Anthostomella pinea TaxID=933095 RepID=A0AAI8VDX5_9PEZI|nr:Uu.00g105020.m01.CDS01 [Anthostomella pinea]
MLAVQPRRWLSRPKGLVIFAITVASLYWFLLHGYGGGYTKSWYGAQDHDGGSNAPSVDSPKAQEPISAPSEPITEAETPEQKQEVSSLQYLDLSDPNSPTYVKSFEDKMKEAEDQKEVALREQFGMEHEQLGREPGADAFYGKTLMTLSTTKDRPAEMEAHLTPADNLTYFSAQQPYIHNPYPNYNKKAWLAERARYSPCEGPTGEEVSDIMAFKGLPKGFPTAGIGSYSVLGIDGDLCYERETRLGMYGFQNANDTSIPSVDWDNVQWGRLQEKCVQKNKARFGLVGEPNPYVTSVYSRQNTTPWDGAETDYDLDNAPKLPDHDDNLRRGHMADYRRGLLGKPASDKPKVSTESRTALLLRTYIGKEYNENDKQAIRALITELSLRTGGQYQVFLFVHVKDNAYAIWDDEATYQYVLEKNVPAEFRDIAVLWNDEAVQAMYPRLNPEQATVHVAQWLSVQKFAQEFPEFDYIWNWEMDARITGHHYDFLEKLASFSKRQPRRGLWERNERYYIPSLHGDYDTDFRKDVEERSGKETVWGPIGLPFITPVGPKPPVERPEEDDYKWGVGEEADLITVAPIFNVKDSGWIGGNDLWGFNDSTHATQQLPRRATIVTHSRISKKLLDIMHVENLRGNHIASEMTCQTIALLHGLKTVYAPMPIFFDRAWKGKDIGRWFNSGRKGESGGFNSAMGWGREARYGGTTWYYRATPPQRLYNNLMGYEDTGIGGETWEEENGRICLPSILMHPIKDVAPTEPGFESDSHLPFG